MTNFWQARTNKLTALLLLLIAPTLCYALLRFATAMGWRLVGNTPYYKMGYVLTVLAMITLLISLFFIARIFTNSFRRRTRLFNISQTVAAFAIAVISIIFSSNSPVAKNLINDMLGKVYYLESVTPESFVKLKNTIDNAIFPPTKIIISSGGGNAFAGLAIGYLIHEKQLDVEVIGRCYSSCANYLFPAGNRKVLNKNAIVMYHGNTLQQKFIVFHRALEEVDGDITKLPPDLDLGTKDKELFITLPSSSRPEDVILSNAEIAVFDYLGWHDTKNFLSNLSAYIATEKQFYERLGIDQKIGIYGQTGDYQALYESKEYDGFYYSIEDMKKMGIQNIRVKDGPWQPELNPIAERLYKVSL